MELADIAIVGSPLIIADSADVARAEAALGTRFPSGYAEYVAGLGEGVFGGFFVQLYLPGRILTGPNNVAEWRERIQEYWFWDEGRDILSKAKALECVILGDTLQGDEIVFHPTAPDQVYILPRYNEMVYKIDGGLWPALEWICSSGELTEPFSEREFMPASH